MLEEKNGNVLNVGRNARTVTPQLKRALDVRDTTCRFPGCCESHYVDYHHIKHWAEGGETSKNNLIKLCRFHHDVLHEGKYNIENQGDGNYPQFVFKTPDGKVIKPIHSRTQNEETTVNGTLNEFEQRWPNIDANTIKPSKWDKGLDYSVVINDMVARSSGPVHNNRLAT